jgi:dTMP kinase
MYIAIDGIDGCGKSTVIERLKSKLFPSDMYVFTNQPGGTPEGLKIRELLLNKDSNFSPLTQLLLFMADRIHQSNRIIKPAISQEKHIICDRSIAGTYAYQVAGVEPSVHALFDSLIDTDELILPDLIILLSISPSEAYSRIMDRNKEHMANDTFESQGIKFLDKVNDGFKQFCDRYSKQLNIQIISVDMKSVEEVTALVLHNIAQYFAQTKNQ